jgi:hypothetical protein
MRQFIQNRLARLEPGPCLDASGIVFEKMVRLKNPALFAFILFLYRPSGGWLASACNYMFPKTYAETACSNRALAIYLSVFCLFLFYSEA